MNKWVLYIGLGIISIFLLSCSPQNDTPQAPTIQQETLTEFSFIWPQSVNPETAQKAVKLRREMDGFVWLNEIDRVISNFKEIMELVEAAYPDHPSLQAFAANDYGFILNLVGRNDIALPWHEKAYSLNEKSDKMTPHYLDRKMRILANLGETHIRLNNMEKAKEYYRRAFDIKPVFGAAQPSQTSARERTMMIVANWRTDYSAAFESMFAQTSYVPDPDGHTKAMDNYAELLKVLSTGQYKIIENAFTNYYDQMLTSHHPRSRYVYSAYGNKALVSSLFLNGEWVDEFLEKSVKNGPKYGVETKADQDNILGGVLNVSDTYIRRGQLEKAEELLDTVHEQLIKKQSRPNRWHVTYNNHLSELYLKQGKPERSLYYTRKAFELSAKVNLQIPTVHHFNHLNLARRLAAAGYHEQSLDEYQALLSSLENLSKPEGNTYISAQHAYAYELFAQGRAIDALKIFANITQQTKGINKGVNRDYVNALVGAAASLNYLGRNESAMAYMKQALRTAPKVYDKASLLQITLKQVHIRILAGLGNTKQALELSNNIYQTQLKNDVSSSIKNQTLSDQVSFYLSLGETERALTIVKSINENVQAENIDKALPLYILTAITENYLQAKLQDNASNQNSKLHLLEGIWPLYQKTVSSERRRIFAEAGASADDHITRNIFGKTMMLAYYVGDDRKAFEVAQQLLTSKASRASETVLQRESVSSAALRRRLQKRNIAAEKLRKLENTYVQSFSGTRKDIDLAKFARNKGRQVLKTFDSGMAGYLKTANINGLPQPVSIKSVQKKLQQNEAVLMIAQTGYDLLIFAITNSNFSMVSSSSTPKALNANVKLVRNSLSITGSEQVTFDYTAAKLVHDAIFAPEIQETFNGVTSVRVITNGSLSTLPLSVLTVGNRPRDFLVNQYAFSTLTSLGQVNPKTSRRSKHGFVGIGAPLLSNTPPKPQINAGQNAYFLRGSSNISQLRMLPNLIGAKKELTKIAQTLDYEPSRLLLGSDATEKSVRAFDFSGLSVAVFATHGLIAGELTAGSEPALVMTPISDDDPNNDGLLTQSEILGLDMDVNWVILSACSSASGETDSAPGLTGLASAFLYAGADSLLVSHWPVRDDAAAYLTVGAVQNTQNGMSKAKALQTAMIDLMHDKDIPNADHPAIWAPFVLVGN